MACMANRALLPGIKKTKEENFMWKEAFHTLDEKTDLPKFAS